jgi:hypothetical protein
MDSATEERNWVDTLPRSSSVCYFTNRGIAN